MEDEDMPQAGCGEVFERYEVIDDVIYDMSPPPVRKISNVIYLIQNS